VIPLSALGGSGKSLIPRAFFGIEHQGHQGNVTEYRCVRLAAVPQTGLAETRSLGLRRRVDKQRVPTLISLQYPNGRIHELESPQDLKPGQEFEMYGHQWKVVGVSRPAGSYRYGRRGERRFLCRPHGE